MTIDENTKLPVRATWAVITVVAAGAFWFTSIYFSVATAQADIRQIRQDLNDNSKADSDRDRAYVEVLHRIDKRLSRIEERMNIPPLPKGD